MWAYQVVEHRQTHTQTMAARLREFWLPLVSAQRPPKRDLQTSTNRLLLENDFFALHNPHAHTRKMEIYNTNMKNTISIHKLRKWHQRVCQ